MPHPHQLVVPYQLISGILIKEIFKKLPILQGPTIEPTAPEMYTLDQPTSEEYPMLLDIWEASVKATHHFLSEQDIAYYKQLIQENQVFHQVKITVIRNSDNEILGFMGVADDRLEMLFLKPEAMGKGIGTRLLQHAVNELHVWKVDVNEQNLPAVKFYTNLGFKVVTRSEQDDQGKSFPILHLQLFR